MGCQSYPQVWIESGVKDSRIRKQQFLLASLSTAVLWSLLRVASFHILLSTHWASITELLFCLGDLRKKWICEASLRKAWLTGGRLCLAECWGVWDLGSMREDLISPLWLGVWWMSLWVTFLTCKAGVKGQTNCCENYRLECKMRSAVLTSGCSFRTSAETLVIIVWPTKNDLHQPRMTLTITWNLKQQSVTSTLQVWP